MADLKIYTDNIEEKALEQINTLLQQDAFKECRVRIMPDVHAGAGCVIGFTANLGNKVIPNVVGVDIGCGMAWAKLGIKQENLDLPKLDEFIRNNIPSGMNIRECALYTDIKLNELYCFGNLRNADNYLEKSLGTLGGGNHFIEIDKDKNNELYLIIHSGSRNLGKQVCDIYQEKAIKYCSFDEECKKEKQTAIEELKKQGKQREISQTLKDIDKKYNGKLKLPKDLCYIENKDRDDYLHDMRICQKWALENRLNMINKICEFLNIAPDNIIQTVHNYIGDDNIVRKGAISAKNGEVVLIPMNMRDGCIIAKGKGNEDWNNSAPHGAGRIMSRLQAKENIKLDDYELEMSGIYTSSVCDETKDEAPMVYKPMQEIVEHIKDTVEIIDIIKPIYNFKAKE